MVRHRLNQIGGPYALTFTAWLITLPLSVLISSVYATTPTLREVVVWSAALVAIHVALGVVMWIGRVTVLPNRSRPSRPWTALVVFAVMGLLRAVLLTWAQEQLGLGSFNLTERLSFNIVATTALFSILAIVIDEYRTDAAIVQRLHDAEESLAHLQSSEALALRDVDQQILTDVHEQLANDLSEEGVDSARIRELSEDVVRALSHELAKPIDVSTLVPASTARTTRWLAVPAVIGRMRLPNPWLVIVTFQALVFGPAASRWGLGFAVIYGVLSSLPTVAVLTLLRRYLPLPDQPLLRLVTLSVPLGFLVAAVTAVDAWIVTTWFNAFLPTPYTVALPATSAGVVGLTLTISAWVAVSEGRADRQQALTDAVANQARAVTELQSVVNERRQSAAHFLHGSVQNELVAASLRGDSMNELQSTVAEIFDSYGTSQSGHNARTTLEGLLTSWAAVLDISVRIDDAAWAAVALDPAKGALLVDLVSEGLTNAVRHARGRALTLEVSAAGSGLDVRIITPGPPKDTGSAGLGLQTLRERGAEVSLSAEDDRTVLAGHLR